MKTQNKFLSLLLVVAVLVIGIIIYNRDPRNADSIPDLPELAEVENLIEDNSSSTAMEDHTSPQNTTRVTLVTTRGEHYP